MGCFSYSCQLSGLPITSGNKSVIVPVIPKDNWYDNSEENIRQFGKSCFVSNDGPNVFFDELCFPIFGYYDDYGSIDNIVEDDNTKVLEEFFGLEIGEIVTVLTDGRKYEFSEGSKYCDFVGILEKDNPRHMLLLKASCIWINGDFYEEISNFQSKKEYFDSLNLGVNGILTELGFKLVKENKRKNNSEKGRYYKVYEKDGLILNSDGNWIHVSLSDEIYNFIDLKKYCESKGVLIDITNIEKKGLWEQIYDYILPDVKDLQKQDDRWNTKRVIDMLLGNEYFDDDIESFSSFDEEGDDISGEITQFYFQKIKSIGNNFMRKNIINWHKVKSYYYPTGRYLIPIGTSPQDGDYKKVKDFLELALNTINKIIG